MDIKVFFKFLKNTDNKEIPMDIKVEYFFKELSDREKNYIGKNSDSDFESTFRINDDYRVIFYKRKQTDPYNSRGSLKNIYRRDGKFIFDQWYDYVINFNDLFIVSRKGKYNVADNSGAFIFDNWFDYFNLLPLEYEKYGENGRIIPDGLTRANVEAHKGTPMVARAVSNGKMNILNPDGTLCSDMWFDEIYNLNESNDLFVIVHKSKCNILNRVNGTLLYNDWFSSISSFRDNEEGKHPLHKAVKNAKVNYILKSNGRLISDEWFDSSYTLHNYETDTISHFLVKDDQHYIVSDDGKIFPFWDGD